MLTAGRVLIPRVGYSGKMKELGNMFLGKIGLSTDNFKMEKDPNTGSYSIQFVK